MDFDLDDEQAMLRDMVTRFVADRYALADRMRYRAEPSGFSTENWRLLASLGLTALPFTAEHGGLGGGRVELMVVAEALGAGLCAEPWLSDLLLAARLLERAGDDRQRGAWLPGIIAGEKRIALAHVEHAARFNPLLVRCEARDGVLNGTKTFVLAGRAVDAYIVSAREHGAVDSPDGLSLWLVPADSQGLTRIDYRLTDGSVACEIALRDARGAQRLGRGADALLATFDEARVAACAEMVGVMQMLFDATLEHLRTRRQFGQPIGSFQAIQHRMADLYVLCEQSRSHLLRAALSNGDDEASAAAVAGAKSFISRSAVALGEECIQFHGGMGTTEELAIGHGHKRILVLASLLGDADSELARYARLVA